MRVHAAADQLSPTSQVVKDAVTGNGLPPPEASRAPAGPAMAAQPAAIKVWAARPQLQCQHIVIFCDLFRAT